MFELEATEETVQAAQQEQQQPCPFGEFDATTTRIESSVFIPVSSYFVPDMERRNIYKFPLLRARPPSYPAAAGLRDRTPAPPPPAVSLHLKLNRARRGASGTRLTYRSPAPSAESRRIGAKSFA